MEAADELGGDCVDEVVDLAFAGAAEGSTCADMA